MDRLSALLVGVAMGALLQRVRASDPGMIARNLRLEDLSIIKFMATTIAVGAVVVSLAGLALPMHLDIKPAYLVGVLAGGLVFGVGFGLGRLLPGHLRGRPRRGSQGRALGAARRDRRRARLHPALRARWWRRCCPCSTWAGSPWPTCCTCRRQSWRG